jgi:hypothetical protein
MSQRGPLKLHQPRELKAITSLDAEAQEQVDILLKQKQVGSLLNVPCKTTLELTFESICLQGGLES